MSRQATLSAWIGFDPREADAYCVAYSSMVRRSTAPVRAHGLHLWDLEQQGIYRRPHTVRDGQLWDTISDAPMSTEFACSRFLVPYLAQQGWALFVDSDVLFRESIMRLFSLADPQYAVMVVKHDYQPTEKMKMDGQIQTTYTRKNWSSVVLWNCDHAANRRLTLDVVNSARGLDLHQFCWLEDDEIGSLPPEWNWLEGTSPLEVDPKIVHFTEGIPRMLARNCEYQDEWSAELAHWLR